MRWSYMHRILRRRLSVCRLRLHLRTTICLLWLHGGCGAIGGLLLGIGVLLGLGVTQGDARFDMGICGGGVAGADKPEDDGG